MIPSAGGYFYDTCRRTDKIVYPVAASPLETHRRRRYPADGQPLEKSITHATSERCCGVARCNPQHLLRTTLSSDIKNSTARPNSGSRTRLRTIHNPPQTASRSVMRACKARCAAQYTMYGQAAQHGRGAFRTQLPGDRAILAPGFVAARSCSIGYTTLTASRHEPKSPRSRPCGIMR